MDLVILAPIFDVVPAPLGVRGETLQVGDTSLAAVTGTLDRICLSHTKSLWLEFHKVLKPKALPEFGQRRLAQCSKPRAKWGKVASQLTRCMWRERSVRADRGLLSTSVAAPLRVERQDGQGLETNAPRTIVTSERGIANTGATAPLEQPMQELT